MLNNHENALSLLIEMESNAFYFQINASPWIELVPWNQTTISGDELQTHYIKQINGSLPFKRQNTPEDFLPASIKEKIARKYLERNTREETKCGIGF